MSTTTVQTPTETETPTLPRLRRTARAVRRVFGEMADARQLALGRSRR